ncbi:MAG: NADH-quinone oxidoreductase subunit NuoE [Clostridia bacterium]|nr:NADH-quinone oxidoreductase subunit NuoE [Clostridia bacterium]
MSDKKTEIPFAGTAEQERQLNAVIAEHKEQEGALMPVMQKAQEIYGYLPIEVQKMIAAGLNIPLEQVYGVSTFYSQFNLEPKGEHLIRVCMGTACYVRGSQDILTELERELKIEAGHTTPDGRFTLEATRCLGCCGLAPVIMIDDDVFGRLTPAAIKDIVAKYRK